MDNGNIVTLNIEEILTLNEAYERLASIFKMSVNNVKLVLYELEHTRKLIPTHVSFSNIDQSSEASVCAIKIKAYKERKNAKYDFLLDYAKKGKK